MADIYFESACAPPLKAGARSRLSATDAPIQTLPADGLYMGINIPEVERQKASKRIKL